MEIKINKKHNNVLIFIVSNSNVSRLYEYYNDEKRLLKNNINFDVLYLIDDRKLIDYKYIKSNNLILYTSLLEKYKEIKNLKKFELGIKLIIPHYLLKQLNYDKCLVLDDDILIKDTKYINQIFDSNNLFVYTDNSNNSYNLVPFENRKESIALFNLCRDIFHVKKDHIHCYTAAIVLYNKNIIDMNYYYNVFKQYVESNILIDAIENNPFWGYSREDETFLAFIINNYKQYIKIIDNNYYIEFDNLKNNNDGEIIHFISRKYVNKSEIINHYFNNINRDYKKVFISYCRTSGEYAALSIFNELTKLGLNCFMDCESLTSGNWQTQLETMIKNSDYFLIIFDEQYLQKINSEEDNYIKREIEIARKNNKTLVIYQIRSFNWNITKSSEFLMNIETEFAPQPISSLKFKNSIKILKNRLLI